MQPKILITGGKGFIGGHLKKIFPSAATYDLKDNQDILDFEKLVEAMRGIDVVVHLAALISVNESIQYPEKYYKTNVEGTENVLKAAVEAGCKTVIFASSAAVYSADNPYGLSKKQGEELMQKYKDRIQTISLRFFNIYGPNQNPEYAGVISKFFAFAKEKQPLKVTGDGMQTRDFISVFDIVSVIKEMIEKGDAVPSGSVFEVGKGSSITINDLAKLFAEKYHLDIVYVSGEPVGIQDSKANNASLLQVIGDYPFKSLSQGLDELAPFLLQ